MARSEGVERQPHAVDVFAADAAVGADLARVDWAATSLGEPAEWPQSLRTAVSILLSSRFSMWLAWGPDLTFFCNDAYRRDTLGRKYPWALGRPASEVWQEIWGDIGPRIDRVLSTGKATWDEGLLLFLRRSGYPEETYHTFSYSPLHDESGAVVGMLCVVSEDTERVISQRRLATLRELGSDPSVIRAEPEALAFSCRQLADNPRDLPFTLTYLFDGDETRLAGSSGISPDHPAARYTWPLGGETVVVPLDDLPGLPTGAWPEPPEQALVVPLLQQGQQPFGVLVAGLNRYRPVDDGYRGFVELVAGHIAAGISGARSYESQQRRAEELAELDRAKTAFFSNVSHEFRTPLTLIMGPLADLRARLSDDDERVREDLDVIQRNSLRLNKLVTTLLDFSRIESGRMQARYAPVELAGATAELASMFRSAVERAGLAFHVDCPPLDEAVRVDRGLWEKVVLNLLSNALKFTFDGSIGVTVRREGGRAVVTISDTGVGVPAEEMGRLFERFHRIENTRSRSNEGSGIGLALVRELVELHGGTISAESTEGEGTRFTIRLPFGSDHVPDDALTPAAATPNPYVQEALRWLPSGEGGAPIERPTAARVLVADDNADMREYVTRLLSDAGYRVDAVEDGRAALDAIRESAPDLVISDVMMPRLDGLALVAALRADARTASLPVLLLSARAGQEASIEGLQAGADDYLVKPFSAAELLARVRSSVEMTRLRTHHARWRAALIDSLQEAFFLCDADGTVIEINSAFTDILGYGQDGLPYRPVHPWWPDAETDPAGHRRVAEAFAALLDRRQGSYTIPAVHRDGHRLWINVTSNHVHDPDNGRSVTVGTFRDVTAEHHAIQRDSALASVSTHLAQATTMADALAGALADLHGIWRADSATAVLFDAPDSPSIWSTGPASTWHQLPVEQRDKLTELREHPLLTPHIGASGAGVRLDHPDGPLNLWIELGPHRPFTGADQLLLSLLAGHIAQGLLRAHQIDQQRETAIALQRAILGPSHLPEGFAVRYEPATRPLEVGGDWYETVALPGDQIGIVVGDCVGRGLKAAAVMGQLRSACRALLLQDPNPARALMALDQFAAALPDAACTTVFCGVLDPATGRLTYSSAGHPPGIVVSPDGGTHLLEGGRSLPLAVRSEIERPEEEFVLPPRSTLLVYTDGLVERRRHPLSEGIDHAAAVLQRSRDSTVDDLATRVMDGLAPAGGYDDDVALLLYRHPGPLDIAFPATAAQLPVVRGALRGWLAQCAVPSETAQSILVAAGEACANAVEHGHRDRPGATVRLRAEASVDAIRLAVTDSGQWRSPRPKDNPHRGHGTPLMRALMDEVTITPGPTGTRVDLQTRIA